jgi:hypothetical protein
MIPHVLLELAAAEAELNRRAKVWLACLKPNVPLDADDMEMLRLLYLPPEPKEKQ